MVTPDDVKVALLEVRLRIGLGRNRPWKRDALSVRALAEGGLLTSDIWPTIRELRPDEYRSGPEPDDDPTRPPGDVWVFMPVLRGARLYVKLKLLCDDGTVECCSFKLQ